MQADNVARCGRLKGAQARLDIGNLEHAAHFRQHGYKPAGVERVDFLTPGAPIEFSHFGKDAAEPIEISYSYFSFSHLVARLYAT